MNHTEEMIPVEEAFRILDETLSGSAPSGETVAVRGGAGRVLLEDQVSRIDLPPFNKSAMDGYAILDGDERDEYRLIETVAAGEVGSKRLEAGSTVKVMTGAAVPDGTGKVVMVEYAEEDGDVVRIKKHGGPPNICWKAEDVRAGDVIMPAGTVLTVVDVANLISCGIREVKVARRIRMAVLSTGDEIVDSPDLLAPGKIMNSNGPLLTGLAERYGLEVVSEEIVPDDRDRTAAAIRAGLEQADIVVISGGVSVGDFDYVIGALADVGLTLHFSRVAAKPGRPMTYASAPGKAVFGLPGNPVSVFLTFHLHVLRAAALMAGASAPTRELRLPLDADFKRRKTERVEYVPCRITPQGKVAPAEYHGSAHLLALSQADGFFVVPVGAAEIRAGEEVACFPFMRRLK